jgi:hypothetical protein
LSHFSSDFRRSFWWGLCRIDAELSERPRAYLSKGASEDAPNARTPANGRLGENRGKTMLQQDIKAASAVGSSCLFIGQNRRGQWVVRDARSICGGLFENRTEAIRFAMYECQRRPQSVIMLPDGLELDLGFGGDLNVNPKIQRAA